MNTDAEIKRRSEAKELAERDFCHEKKWAHPSRAFGHELPLRYARMRNAWVAYHAGASWMHPGQSAMVRMARSNAQLRAEAERMRKQRDEARAGVERLRSELFEARRIQEAAEKHARWKDDDNAQLRAEVERWKDAHKLAVSSCYDEHGEARRLRPYAARKLLRDALAQEDGGA